MPIPGGICIDLETTISSKIPDHIRPPGKKRYETRILEIGAIDWQNPTIKYQALVSPILHCPPMNSTAELFRHLTEMHQHPTRTIDFWSKVLVKRHSLTRHMFSIEESPEVWLARQVHHRAKDFIRWHKDPSSGPMFVSEKQALEGLLRFTREHEHSCWLAHNGNSFDFKVLEGCSERTLIPMIPKVRKVDTLRLFRKCIPGHKSYSQPVLYEALFNKKYNAHVAIDDAIALATLCRHVERSAVVQAPAPKTRRFAVSEGSGKNKLSKSITKKQMKSITKKPMNLVFSRHLTTNAKIPKTQRSRKSGKVGKLGLQSVQRLKGIGPKTAGALAAVQITTIDQLAKKYKQSGDTWLKSILPYGARFNVIRESISNPCSFSR